jgi:hypothetical protein
VVWLFFSPFQFALNDDNYLQIVDTFSEKMIEGSASHPVDNNEKIARMGKPVFYARGEKFDCKGLEVGAPLHWENAMT